MADIGPHNSVGGYNSNEVNWDAFYNGMYGARPTQVANQAARSPITPSQLAAIQSVPSGSYRTPPNAPIQLPNIPAGSMFADTGNKGRATADMRLQLASVGGGIRPAWTIPQAQPATPNVPLPRARPWNAPTAIDMAAINQPVGANPGIGGALLGNGVMSPAIPPQQPPADGSSPLPVWADAPAGGFTAPGSTPRPLTGAERYSLANAAGQQAALDRQANATGIAGGYQYINGKRVGYAPRLINGQVLMPTNGASAYGLANAAGQIAALQRQAAGRAAGLMTPVEQLQAQGMSAAAAYNAANSGPGSVSAMEAWHGGGGGGGGPAGGGDYGGGSNKDSPAGPPKWVLYGSGGA